MDNDKSKKDELKKEEDSPILDNILSLNEESSDTSILGKDVKLFRSRHENTNRFNPGWQLVKLSILFGLCIVLYFYLQLNFSNSVLEKYLGQNYTAKAEQSSSELITIQTKINKSNYLAAKLHLDTFVYLADTYQHKLNQLNSQFSQDKEDLSVETKNIKEQITEELKIVRNKLNQPILPLQLHSLGDPADLRLSHKQALIEQIENDKRELIKQIASSSEDIKSELRKEIQNLETIKVLLNDVELQKSMTSITLEELSDYDINQLLKQVNELTKNDFSIISKLKNQRARWSQTIKDIERITKNVDFSYGHSALSDLEEVKYSAFTLDDKTGKITITGYTKRDDARNFTLLANLIDAFEESIEFSDVVGRTFQKSEESRQSGGRTSFVAPLRLSFLLQEGNDPRDSEYEQINE